MLIRGKMLSRQNMFFSPSLGFYMAIIRFRKTDRQIEQIDKQMHRQQSQNKNSARSVLYRPILAYQTSASVNIWPVTNRRLQYINAKYITSFVHQRALLRLNSNLQIPKTSAIGQTNRQTDIWMDRQALLMERQITCYYITCHCYVLCFIHRLNC